MAAGAISIRTFGAVVLALALLFPSAAVRAQEAPAASGVVLVNASSRRSVDFSGIWRYAVDPYRTAVYGFRGDVRSEDHRKLDPADLEKIAREDPMAFSEYDMRLAPAATLPGSWVGHDPSLRYFPGLMWYERAFEAPRRKGERAFLHFEAVNYIARVYLNGVLVGVHEGGFTPFAFEVTDILKSGENRVTLAVDAARREDSVPPVVTDWDTYGGVTRPVRLVFTPRTFIDDAFIRLTRDGRIAASVRLNGDGAAGAKVKVRIPGAAIELKGRADSSGRWEASLPAPEGLELWSPDSPVLHDVTIESGDDRLGDRIGFRTVEVRGGEILLNGKPIFLRGVCVHEEEIGPEPARIMTEAAIRRLFEEVKDGLHGNFVRLSHYPHSETAVRLADEMGLLIWSEIPVYWDVAWDNPQTLVLARRMLAESVMRDRNRASIILWSVANEAPVNDDRNRFLKTLADDVRTLDDTRLVTAAMYSGLRTEGGVVVATINDPLIDDLDVIAINTYNGWYGSMRPEEIDKIVWRSDYGKPLIFSEFGAGALAGFHDPDGLRKFSEDYQAEYYRRTLAMSEKVPFLRGLSPWILKDFRSPRRQHPVFQQGWNRKGLISETGERKEAFDVLADHYRDIEAKVEGRDE